jgi:hypothetical protein
MSKAAIIPDVHGRKFWRTVKDSVEEYDKVIFLGDYLDPYPYEGITPEEALQEFKDIIEFKRENMEKVTLLIGNHDFHYMLSMRRGCRMDYVNYEEINKLFLDNKDLFSIYEIVDDKYLLSHAGISSLWLSDLNLQSLNVSEILSSKVLSNKMLDVGWERGGWACFGSVIWRDVCEDSVLLEPYYHIFGHSQQQSDPIIESTYACLDCRRAFVLEDGEISEIAEKKKD